MCEIGEKIKPQFKVDLIQFVNATTTCCWNKKKAALEGSFMVRGHSKNHIFQISYSEVDKSLQSILSLEHLPKFTKIWILEEVTSERCNSDQLNTFFITKGYL